MKNTHSFNKRKKTSWFFQSKIPVKLIDIMYPHHLHVFINVGTISFLIKVCQSRLEPSYDHGYYQWIWEELLNEINK